MKRALTQLLSLLVSPALIFSTSGCGKVSFEKSSSGSSENRNNCPAGSAGCEVVIVPGVTEPEVPNPEKPYLDYEFQVPKLSDSVDIVFVIDNSVSMKRELQELAYRFSNMSAALAGKDWQACLATTAWEDEHGALREWADGSFVISKTTENFNMVFNTTVSTILADGPSANANIEQGIITARKIFSEYGSPENKGCLRAGSKKSVIFVSDEDELENGWDPNRVFGDPEWAPRLTNKPATFLNLIDSLFGSDSGFTAHMIGVIPGDTQCLYSQRMELGFFAKVGGYYAHRYNEIVTAKNGLAVSICDQDFSGPLARIGTVLADKVAEYNLGCANGAEVRSVLAGYASLTARSFSVRNSTVVFNPALGAGEKAKVSYRCR